MVYGIFIFIHLLVSIGLVLAVLMQSGKGGGLAGTFGGSATQAVFGGRGAATFLSKATTGLAIAFFVSSMILGVLSSKKTGTSGTTATQRLIDQQQEQGTTAPGGETAVPQQKPGSALETIGSEGEESQSTTKPKINVQVKEVSPTEGETQPEPENE